MTRRVVSPTLPVEPRMETPVLMSCPSSCHKYLMVVKQYGTAHDKAIQAVQKPTVTRQEGAAVLHAGPALERRLEEVAELPHDRKDESEGQGVPPFQIREEGPRATAAPRSPPAILAAAPSQVFPGETAEASLCLPKALPT